MNLSLLKTIGENISKEYSINWENWTDEETKITEKKNKLGLLLYERLFQEFDVSNAEHTIEMFEEIMENLISGYALEALLERKRAVEYLISTV